MLRSRRGFTLLELLMVVIIIGILASIAVPSYLRMAERARASEALTILAAIRSAELRYKAESPAQVWTGVISELDTEIQDPPGGLWDYTIDTTGTGTGIAKRMATVGGSAFPTINIDLLTGAICSSQTDYQLTPCP